MAPDDESNPKVVVLVSGNGSNLQALIDAEQAGQLGGTIVMVVSNVDAAYGLVRAKEADIDTRVVVPNPDQGRREYDARLADVVATANPDLIVLAGWMRVLSGAFLDRFRGRVINLHPALPGEFPGLQAIERAYHDAQANGLDRTGVMVHYVPDEGIDDGPVIAIAEVEIRPDDSLDSLTQRVHDAEHQLLPQTVAALLTPAASRTTTR